MSTQAIAGFVGRVYISVDGGNTYVEMDEVTDIKLSRKTKMLDATSHASAGDEDYIAGTRGWTATIAELYIPAGTASVNLVAAQTAGTRCKFRFDPSGTTGGKERWSGDGFISDWDYNGPNAAPAISNVTVQGAGPLTKSTQ